MFFGNISNPPAVGSLACLIPSKSYNLTTTTTTTTTTHIGQRVRLGCWPMVRPGRGSWDGEHPDG